jgi:hypothetical protein
MTAPASFPAASARLMSFAFKDQSTCYQLKSLIVCSFVERKWDSTCSCSVALTLPDMLRWGIPCREANHNRLGEVGNTVEADISYDVTKKRRIVVQHLSKVPLCCSPLCPFAWERHIAILKLDGCCLSCVNNLCLATALNPVNRFQSTVDSRFDVFLIQSSAGPPNHSVPDR